MTNKCKTCGHEKLRHEKCKFYQEIPEGECLVRRGFRDECPCKKFIPEDENIADSTMDRMIRILNRIIGKLENNWNIEDNLNYCKSIKRKLEEEITDNPQSFEEAKIKYKKMKSKCKTCGCSEYRHELYELSDGSKERIGCLDCGDLICKKFIHEGDKK